MTATNFGHCFLTDSFGSTCSLAPDSPRYWPAELHSPVARPLSIYPTQHTPHSTACSPSRLSLHCLLLRLRAATWLSTSVDIQNRITCSTIHRRYRSLVASSVVSKHQCGFRISTPRTTANLDEARQILSRSCPVVSAPILDAPHAASLPIYDQCLSDNVDCTYNALVRSAKLAVQLIVYLIAPVYLTSTTDLSINGYLFIPGDNDRSSLRICPRPR